MLELASAVTGSGVATIKNNGTLQVDKSLAVSSVQLGSTEDNTLLTENGASMTAQISGFGSSYAIDSIDVLGIKANGLTFLSGTLSLTDNGTTVDQFVFKGSYTQENFKITPDPQDGTDIHYVAAAAAASPDAASAAPNSDLAGSVGILGPWTDNPPAVLLDNGGEGGHGF